MEFKNNNTIVNLSNSIIKNFGLKTFHDTIPEIDNLLKGHKKVVVILYDGMGTSIRKKHEKYCEFIRSGYVRTIQSTFPPTTVAATTGFLTGKYPIENGWMSWTQYFEEYGCNINVFINKDPEADVILRPREEGYILSDICPVTKMFDLINEKRNEDIGVCMGYGKIVTKGLFKSLRNRLRLNKVIKSRDELFVYYYNSLPDHYIHEFGTTSKKVSKVIKQHDNFVKKVVKKNKDTVFIVMADHGLIDCKYLYLNEHEDFLNTLSETKPVTMECRCPAFFVKEGQEETFKELFIKYFGEHFDLYSKEEALAKHIYGEGEQNPHTNQFIGDFVAISKDEYCLVDARSKSFYDVPGRHAGGTPDEMDIDISIFNV